MHNILEITNLSAYYDELQIVQNLSLNFDQGIISIVGRNGMGKTTLAKSIMGLVKTTGSIKFNGTEISKMQPYQRAQLGIGYVPQGRRIFPSLTTDEHLTFCERKAPAGTDEKNIWTVERIYEVLPRLYERRHLPGTSMSGEGKPIKDKYDKVTQFHVICPPVNPRPEASWTESCPTGVL